jgi:hypothetical protein
MAKKSSRRIEYSQRVHSYKLHGYRIEYSNQHIPCQHAYRHPVAAPPPLVRPTLPRMHPECTTLLSGYTRIALPPNRLWHTAQCLSSSMTTLRFRPPGTTLPSRPTLPSPNNTASMTDAFSTPRSFATMRSSFKTELALRMRPRKYDSRSLTGRLVGTRSSVEEAGRRAPCLLKSSRAGGQLGLLGGDGVR